MKSSKHESALDGALRMYGHDLGAFEREFAAIPGRRFRFDFAFPSSRLLIECQGGIYLSKSAHTGASLARDYSKLNEAALHGWRVLMFGPADLRGRALTTTVDTIRRALRASASEAA